MDRVLTGTQINIFNEKLVLVFRNLRKNNNYITRQNFHNTTEEAITALVDMLDIAESKGKRRSGAIYYHRGDRANIAFGKVAIRFTDFLSKDSTQEQSDANAVAIGREIVAELQRAGLYYSWDSSPNSVIWAFFFKEDADKVNKDNYAKVS